MKKEYSKPSMKAYHVKPSSIICGSGGEIETLSIDPEDSSPTFIQYTGSICGE